MTTKGWNWKCTLGVLWAMTFLVLCSIILAIYSISQGWWGYIPPISELQNPINKSATRIYTDDGKLMGTWSYASENRLMLPYDSLPENLVNALVATEDIRFHEHCGIDLRAVGRAVVKRGLMGQKSAGGGSTITQQLVKNITKDDDDSGMAGVFRKAKEISKAYQVEKLINKFGIEKVGDFHDGIKEQEHS